MGARISADGSMDIDCRKPKDESNLPTGSSSSRPPVTRLVLVRHGETAWNVEKRLQGQVDVELNDVGCLQARNLAMAIQRSGLAGEVDAIVSSDLARARATADVLADVCPRCVRAKDDPDLREVHCGELQGRMIKDTRLEAAKVARLWHSGDLSCEYPGGGECAAAVMTRGLRALRRSADLGSTVLVVTHAGLLRWCAVYIALTDGDIQRPPIASAAQIKAPNVQEPLTAAVVNCCCSTVFWERSSERFVTECWFEDICGKEARDDTDRC